MILYAIVSRAQVGTHGVDISLARACAKRGIEYRRLIDDEVVLDDLRTLEVKDALVYRISLSAKATAIEAFLDAFHADEVTTIYYPQTIRYPRKVMYEMLVQMAQGMSVIPTSIVDETWLEMSDDELTERIHRIGGFPAIIKTLGLSHGQGVHKVDSVANLREKLQSCTFEKYKTIVRKYLADYRHYRLIVVDNTVVAAIEYHQPDDDFRTNAVAEPTVTAVDVSGIPAEMQRLAIDTVAIRKSLLGGVDILVEQGSATPLLAEVNVPCYFTRAEGPTGIDIAELIIEAMERKQKEARK